MTHERYEKVLHERGFEIVAGDDRLPVPTHPLVLGLRTRLLSARKRVGQATLDIELQDTRSMNSAALAGTARITGPAIAGEGQLRPRPVWGIWRLLTSGPKILTYVLLFFLVLGVWVVMLPGILLVWLASRGALRRQGLEPRPALIDPAARGHYNVWSRDPEAARAALPAARQAAIGATSWCGICEVRDGMVVLDCPFGYTRDDLFAEFLTACENVAETIGR